MPRPVAANKAANAKPSIAKVDLKQRHGTALPRHGGEGRQT
jgi:hypothetical protein